MQQRDLISFAAFHFDYEMHPLSLLTYVPGSSLRFRWKPVRCLSCSNCCWSKTNHSIIKKDQEHGDCIWMLAVFSRQLHYNLEISLEMFFVVKWSADGKCCLQDTDSRTIGEVTPGQNAILKMQGCSSSFSLVCNFLRSLQNMCHTWGHPLYYKTKHAFHFTNSLFYIALVSGFLVLEISFPSYSRYTWRFIHTEAIPWIWFILPTNVYVATLILFTTMQKWGFFQSISS